MVICGTGHRPDKLGGYGKEVFDKLVSLAHDYLSEQSVDTIISGGALGWDQALAKAAIDLGIPLTMALPFCGFDSRWPKESQQALFSLCTKAKDVVYVCDSGYAPWKMQKRNEWMVDHADRVLALWNGTPGGTANCVRYAEKVGKPIVNLWEMYAPTTT